jgi:hypothetical protein
LQEWLPAEQRALLELIHAVNERSDEALIADGTINFRGYYIHYRRQSMLLDGSARLGLAHGEPCGSLHDAPTGNIMRLWQQRQNLERLRALVLDAFGLHVCIDLMNLGQARLVLSDKPPPAGIEDRLDAEARGFIAAARPLHEFSDGVRTYIGLHTQLIAQDSRFVMIDEPEAFLHPPLARRLGANLSTLAAERGSCVFAATHSPDFLMGCIESGVDVNIVRLGYRNNIATAHLLPQDELKAMMVDPLLRSTGILGAVFHQAAVVVEGDSDRTFYSEVTERLRLHEPATHPAVMRDCVFLNAQGKATVSRILAALRRLGVVSCGIIDLDLLRDPHTCTRLLQAAGASASTRETITDLRAKIARDIEDLADLCEPRGLARASREERKDVNRFIDELETHGIFLPEVGTLEGWLSQLGVDSTNRKAWIPAIFQAMGPVHTGLAPAPATSGRSSAASASSSSIKAPPTRPTHPPPDRAGPGRQGVLSSSPAVSRRLFSRLLAPHRASVHRSAAPGNVHTRIANVCKPHYCQGLGSPRLPHAHQRLPIPRGVCQVHGEHMGAPPSGLRLAPHRLVWAGSSGTAAATSAPPLAESDRRHAATPFFGLKTVLTDR